MGQDLRLKNNFNSTLSLLFILRGGWIPLSGRRVELKFKIRTGGI
jgi:hypothetical protein